MTTVELALVDLLLRNPVLKSQSPQKKNKTTIIAELALVVHLNHQRRNYARRSLLLQKLDKTTITVEQALEAHLNPQEKICVQKSL